MQATRVFINGEVFTSDHRFSVHEAVAIGGNRILGVGTNQEIQAFVESGTEVTDLEGRTLMPGFIDAHAHLELYGTNQLGVNAKAVHSIPELLDQLLLAAEDIPKGQWIRGWGYNQNHLAEQRHLTRDDLDKVSTSHPIIVVRTCGHISCVNTKALELTGITDSVVDPPGGKYHRDTSGRLTGLLMESAHMAMFQHADYSEEEVQKGLAIASADFLELGITSVHDAGGYGTKHIRYLQKAVQEKTLKQRIYALYGSLSDSVSMVEAGIRSGMATGIGDDSFRIGPAKVFIDGSSSGPTCKMREGYTSNPAGSGMLYMDQHALDRSLLSAYEHGWQLTAHAMGDQAVDMLLTTLERARSGRPGTRHRIEHSGFTPADLVQRMKAVRAIPIPNPAFLHEFGDGYRKDYGNRVEAMFPMHAFAQNDIPFAIGSDSPITTADPFVGIHAAITRQSKSGRSIGAEQGITLEEALRAYTWGGAYASGEEDVKGSLKPGMLADLIILDRPVLNTPIQQLPEVTVDETILDGKTVFHKLKEDVY
ncbi:amidohydrolase [Halobacillus sp. BAB-2008]|uniref:amidohydrolase n=1 Tax=Halobacillus sp. BAB-2008 TaxID=1246484 RepID=UPI0002A514B2|nr:amidohydrolase [Halobacillus sp. BAB-2008]ELK45633.1 amidohydrolase 3 [Halobacillus sp. BAB-2008]